MADGKCEGYSRVEVDEIRSEGEAICGREVRLKIDGSWLKCRPVGKRNENDIAPEAEKGSRAFRVV